MSRTSKTQSSLYDALAACACGIADRCVVFVVPDHEVAVVSAMHRQRLDAKTKIRRDEDSETKILRH